MARAIVADVLNREKMRKESIIFSQGIFEMRANVKDFKRKNNLRGDDEDLYDSSKVSIEVHLSIGTIPWNLSNTSHRAARQTFRRLPHQLALVLLVLKV